MNLGTRWLTWIRGQLVGTDRDGNRYYTEKRGVGDRRRRRWVMYRGAAEASKVPPEWHAWLHYTVDQPLPAPVDKPWLKEHKANATGTSHAYLPPGHDRRGGVRSAATGDYEAWKP
jgi:NADH:ubiquinone oxidoreductase subunit